MTPIRNIAFTGHRDRTALHSDLLAIAAEFPDAKWHHGGAVGFDSQVNDCAVALGVSVKVYPPDYGKYGRKRAPLVRNREIVDACDILFACYDGRPGGGTRYTIDYAQGRGIEVRIIEPLDIMIGEE